MGEIKRTLAHLIERAERDDSILAVILFGSRARGEETATSDFDVCLVLRSGRHRQDDQVRARLEYLPTDELDLRIFQQLPLYVRRRVLKDGKVLYCRDLDQLYELAYRTARAFEDFKPHYRQYLEQILNA
jgi:predicted nucleotidyltransferase